jgi:hypothetical protein
VSVYTSAAGTNSHLYNGSEYVDYDHRIKGDPFFASSYFNDGSLVFDGILYPHVTMFYDILHDDVVIKNYNGLPLILAKEKVYSFNYRGHQFANLVTDSLTAEIKPGFYDVLYDGNVKLLAKRKKEFIEKITLQYADSYFIEKDAHYILKNGELYPVSGKRDMLHVLKDKRTSLVKYIQQNKIDFNKGGEDAMIKLIGYYDGLNNAQ